MCFPRFLLVHFPLFFSLKYWVGSGLFGILFQKLFWTTVKKQNCSGDQEKHLNIRTIYLNSERSKQLLRQCFLTWYWRFQSDLIHSLNFRTNYWTAETKNQIEKVGLEIYFQLFNQLRLKTRNVLPVNTKIIVNWFQIGIRW